MRILIASLMLVFATAAQSARADNMAQRFLDADDEAQITMTSSAVNLMMPKQGIVFRLKVAARATSCAATEMKPSDKFHDVMARCILAAQLRTAAER